MANECCHVCGQVLQKYEDISYSDTRRMVLFRGAASAPLAPAHYRLFRTLLDNRGKVVPAAEVCAAIYGPRFGTPREPSAKNLEVMLSRLRRALAPIGLDVRNYRARGYELLVVSDVVLEPVTAYNTASNRSAATINSAQSVEK